MKTGSGKAGGMGCPHVGQCQQLGQPFQHDPGMALDGRIPQQVPIVTPKMPRRIPPRDPSWIVARDAPVTTRWNPITR